MLKSLQGICIPKLYFRGYLRNGLFFIAISDCGSPVTQKVGSDEFKQFEECLKKVHQFQVYHRSIDNRNLVIDNYGKCWIIDFDNAEMASDVNWTYKDDMRDLYRCVKVE